MTTVLKRAFIVGYGNPLRSDDGVGREVALDLWRQRWRAPGLGGATITWAHQLTPELAFDIAGSRVAVFVDAASDGLPPGSVISEVLPVPGRDQTSLATGCWEDISPQRLMAMAVDLFGVAPPGVLVTIGVASLEPGMCLSLAVRAAVPVASRAVLSAIEAAGGAGGPTAPMSPVPERGGSVHA